MRFEVTRQAAAPAERVWDVVADVAHSAQNVGAIESVEMVAGPSPVAVGTTWRETRTMMGQRATQELTVCAVEPGRSYTVRTHMSGTEYESTVSVDPSGSRASRLRISLAARNTSGATRFLGATLGWAIQGVARKVLEQDADDLVAAAEGRPVDSGESGTESGGRPAGP